MLNNILIVARKEFRDDFRNRWTIAISIIFAMLALGIAYFGAVTSGRVGFVSFDTTIASLTTLAAFVVPLISLLVAYDTIVGERNSGTLLLLLSYPLSRIELMTGKFIGHSSVLGVATVIGFGVAVAAIQIMTPQARSLMAWINIVNFMVSATLLGATFSGVACLISVLTHDKAKAAGLALLTWFVFVVLFDLVLLALLVASGGGSVERAIYPYLLLLNPIDVFRLVNLTSLGNGVGNDVFLSMTASHIYNHFVLYVVLLIWALMPFSIALLKFRNQEV